MDSVLVDSRPMATFPFSLASRTHPDLPSILNDSIHRFLIEINKDSRDLSGIRSICSRLLQSSLDPPLEIVWLYSAVCFHESIAYQNDVFAVLAAIKGLLQLFSTCSTSCNRLKSIALLAPAVSELYYCYLGSKNLGGKEAKKVRKEIERLIEGVLGYISISSSKIANGGDRDVLLPGFSDLVRVWTVRHENGKDAISTLFPLVSAEIRGEFHKEGCQIGYLAGVLVAEAFLLRLSLKVQGGTNAAKSELQKDLRIWAVSSISVFQNSIFLDILLRLLLEASLPMLTFLDTAEEALVRDILCDALILSDYSFLNYEIVMKRTDDYFISIFVRRLILTHVAIMAARTRGDQSKAILYIDAFSKSSVPCCLINWVTSQTQFGKIDKPNSSTPQSLLKWLIELEDKGISLFGDISKYRKRVVFDESKASLQNLNAGLYKQTDEELFFFDKKGGPTSESREDHDDDMDMMDGAFIAAAQSIRASADNGSRKRKELGGDDELGPLFKSLKYKTNPSVNDYLSSGNEGGSSGSEVENPPSDDEMDDTN
ncbi:DNA ligase 4 [Rhynchospora pubera]|uniref:DNA ligase 4 n=1 Tax=Rhynchospora pubera TaxID=906938 RepID=A0AAV8DPH5_9POAL|nr:DNA ligase 4 [Rhynchospora pubera]